MSAGFVSMGAMWLWVVTLCAWASAVTSSRALMSQICNAENRVIYCTCQPSDYDIESVDCVLLAEVASPEDPLWRVFGASPGLKDLRLNSRPEGLLKYLPEAMFDQPAARVVYVRHGHIHRLPTSAFRNSSSLQSLDLSSNAIRLLEPHSLAHLAALEELILSENELTHVRRRTIQHLPNLKLLSLDRNRISSIESGALDTLSRLSELELSSNRIKDLKSGFFKGLTGLTRLDLGKNLIEHLPAHVFHECPHVREIVLRDNALQSIDKHALSGLKELYTLYLSRNRLSALHPLTFRPAPNLMYVDLRSNRLATLTLRTVAPLNLTNNATKIYLEDNRFVCDCKIQWMLDMFNLRLADHVSEWKEVRCLPPPEVATAEATPEQQDEPPRTPSSASDLDGYFEGSSSSRPLPSGLPLDKARGFLRDQHCPLPVAEVEELTLGLSTLRNDAAEEEAHIMTSGSVPLPLLTLPLLTLPLLTLLLLSLI